MSLTVTGMLYHANGSPLALPAAGLAARLQDLLSLASVLCCPVLLATVGYGLACWIWSFRNCHDCHGSGLRRSPTGRAFRVCRACTGTGGKLRFGRRVYHRFAAGRRSGR